MVFSLIPIIYLAVEWHNLPSMIRVFWTFKNDARLVPKSSLIYLCLLPFITYHLLLLPQIVPFFDSKDAIAEKPNNYSKLKYIVLFTFFILALAGVNYYQIAQYG